jgi:hypothetical protein
MLRVVIYFKFSALIVVKKTPRNGTFLISSFISRFLRPDFFIHRFFLHTNRFLVHNCPCNKFVALHVWGAVRNSCQVRVSQSIDQNHSPIKDIVNEYRLFITSLWVEEAETDLSGGRILRAASFLQERSAVWYVGNVISATTGGTNIFQFNVASSKHLIFVLYFNAEHRTDTKYKFY